MEVESGLKFSNFRSPIYIQNENRMVFINEQHFHDALSVALSQKYYISFIFNLVHRLCFQRFLTIDGVRRAVTGAL